MWIFNLSLSLPDSSVIHVVFRSGRLVSHVHLHVIRCAWYSSSYSVSSRQPGHLSLKVRKQTVNDRPLQLPNQRVIKTKQQNLFFFPSCRQPECLACRFLTHLSFQNRHVREQRKALLVLVLLNINASFLPLSTQRDRGLTNVLRLCVIRCLRSGAASSQEAQRTEQAWTWNSSLAFCTFPGGKSF